MTQLATTLRQHGVDTSLLRRMENGEGTPLYQLTTRFQDRLEIWLRLRQIVEQTAHWSVIVDDVGVLANYQDKSWAGTPAQILDEARALSAEGWLIQGTDFAQYPDAHQIIAHLFEAIEEEHSYHGDQ